MSYYARSLAQIHHAQFGQIAERAATTVIQRLQAAGFESGTVVDLGCGSGLLCRRLVDMGFEAWGVDSSPEMLAIARKLVPEAEFVEASVYDVRLPSGAVAVCAVGEILNYAADLRAGPEALDAVVAAARAALVPGGLLVFDVATPGRAGPTGRRDAFFEGERYALFVHAEESEDEERLTRVITLFTAREDGLYERSEERHLLRLHRKEDVEASLHRHGFSPVESLIGYASEPFLVGWSAWCAVAPAVAV